MTICKGCGINIQYENSKKLGYSPKENVEYCQRCFRIKHYDDYMYSMKTGINSDEVLQKIAKLDCIILWVVDLFDFESSIINGINKHLIGKDILMIVTKRDLMLKDVSDFKLTKFIKDRLKDLGINVKGILLTSKNEKQNKDEILNLLRQYSNNKDIVVMGKANVGKSTFLNMLKNDDTLTRSIYPGTTLDFVQFEINGMKFIDTPGLNIENSVISIIDEKQLNLLIPNKTIKPIIFQLNKNQSIFLEGLIKIDFLNCSGASVVIYCGENINIHRTKYENSQKIFENRYNQFKLNTKNDMISENIKVYHDKMDIVIYGLGFICVDNKVKDIKITYPKNINVIYRKAMF